MANPELQITLDQAVYQIQQRLFGLEQHWKPESPKYYLTVDFLNQALRMVATELEWNYFASTEEVGTCQQGVNRVPLRAAIRPRINIDDSVRLEDNDGVIHTWAHFLPREAIHKSPDRNQLWVAHEKASLQFSRGFRLGEAGLKIMVPVMREPKLFRLPDRPEDPMATEPLPVPIETRRELVDFEWPDLVILKAMYLYAQTDPILQPRVQTLEANYQDLFYALRDREQRNTDAPFMNPFFVPIENDIFGHTPVSHRPQGESWWLR